MEGGVPGGSTTERDVLSAQQGFPPDVCGESIDPESGIPAIVEPAFASEWRGRDIDPAYRHDQQGTWLVDEQTIIGVTWRGGARAYPLRVLRYHEIVYDDADGPILVSYCPLCSIGMVASRRVAGTITAFAVSGLLWIPERLFARTSERRGRTFGAAPAGGRETDVRLTGNLVLYDAETRSYWSQLLARAICGPRSGTELSIRPSTLATLAEWREEHQGTDVCSRHRGRRRSRPA